MNSTTGVLTVNASLENYGKYLIKIAVVDKCGSNAVSIQISIIINSPPTALSPILPTPMQGYQRQTLYYHIPDGWFTDERQTVVTVIIPSDLEYGWIRYYDGQ